MGSAGKHYSIAAVSKLTGVSCHALRIWERRYGFPVPNRSPSGHRRYSADQVGALSRIAALVKGGRAIGDLIGEHLAGTSVEGPAPPVEPSGPSVPNLIDRLMDGDPMAGEREYGALAAGRGPTELISMVLEPAMVEIGERWFRGDCDIFQERGASGFLRRKLAGLLDEAQRANPVPGRRVIVGTVQGDRHEGGVLMLALLLERAGWRALSMGVDLPVGEYRKAVEGWRPDALALSFVMSRNINKRFQELGSIREIPIFVGGRSILNYQGLARRHGLIPLPGPAAQVVAPLLSRFEQWHASRPFPARG